MRRGLRAGRRFLDNLLYVMTIPAFVVIAVLAEALGELEEP